MTTLTEVDFNPFTGEKKPTEKKVKLIEVEGNPFEDSEISREYTPTKETSTITGKPKVEWTPTGEPSTKLSALLKTGFLDDTQQKIKVFAQYRGIPEDRYSVHNGEIIYQGDDGNWYPETKKTIGAKTKEFLGETPAYLPSAVLGGVMTGTMGIPGAFIGGGVGEGIRQFVGEQISGEEMNPIEGLLKMGLAGTESAAGALLGRATVRGINAHGSKKGGTLAYHAGKNRTMIDPVATRELERSAADLGIDLYPPQTTGSKVLADKFNLLGDLETSGPTIQAARKKQYEQIDDAVYNFLKYLSPEEKGELEVGKKIVEGSKSVLQGLKESRSQAVKELYKQARDITGLDISSTLSKVDDMLAQTKPGLSDYKSLTKIKSMLTNKVKDESGNLVSVPEDRLVILDKVKKEINSLWRADPKSAPQKEVQKQLNDILDEMLGSIDKQAPVYDEARKLFGQLSPDVNAAQSGKIGRFAKLNEDKDFIEVSRNLFKNMGNSPETIKKTKSLLYKENPQSWDDALSVYLQDIFEKTKASASGADTIPNVGGNFFKRTFGDPKQRKILRSAMEPEQFEYFTKLMNVLDRAGMILRKESATATRQEMIEDIGGTTIRRAVVAATRPMVTKDQVIGNWIMKARLGSNAKELAEAMVSKKSAEQLSKMYQLGPNSKKFIPMFGSFLANIGVQDINQFNEKLD